MGTKVSIQDIIETISANDNEDSNLIENFSKTFFEILESSLQVERLVRIKGLGTFKLIEVGERESINVNTGERFQIEGHSKVSFTPETDLKNKINKPFSHFQTVIVNEGTDLNKLEEVKTPNLELNEKNSATTENINSTQESDEYIQETKSFEVRNQTNFKEEQTETELIETDYTKVIPTENNQTESQYAKNEFSKKIINKACGNEVSKQLYKEKKINTGEPVNIENVETQDKNSKTERHIEVKNESEQILSSDKIEFANEDKDKTSDSIEQHPQFTKNDNSELEKTTKVEVAVTRIPPFETKLSWLKVSLAFIIILVLMVLCYLVGYYKIFDSNSSYIIKNDSKVAEKEIRLKPNVSTKIAVSTTNDTIKKCTIQQDTPQDSSKLYKQLPGGKYLIMGVLKKHIIKEGESILSLAKFYYGSSGYAPYIILFNNIEDPDNITIGKTIKLPKLERYK